MGNIRVNIILMVIFVKLLLLPALVILTIFSGCSQEAIEVDSGVAGDLRIVATLESGEMVAITPDGTVQEGQIFAYAILSVSNDVMGFVGGAVDISVYSGAKLIERGSLTSLSQVQHDSYLRRKMLSTVFRDVSSSFGLEVEEGGSDFAKLDCPIEAVVMQDGSSCAYFVSCTNTYIPVSTCLCTQGNGSTCGTGGGWENP